MDWLENTSRAEEWIRNFINRRMTGIWDHQERSIWQIRACWQRNPYASVLVALPTGAGKTRIGSAIVRLEFDAGRRILWLVHRIELLNQTMNSLEKFEIGMDPMSTDTSVGEYSGRVHCSRRIDVCKVNIAMIQTLLEESRRGRNLPSADTIIIDEAHHYAARMWKEILCFYPNTRRLLLSATPERPDGIPLLTDHIIAPIQPRELIRQGILVDCTMIGPKRALDSGEIAQDPIDAWKKWAYNKRTVVFCQSRKHAREVAKNFSENDIQAECVLADTHEEERFRIWEKLKNGEIYVITNVYVATEGLDVPELEVCIVARSVSHRSIWIQMVGRVMRSCEQKRHAIIIDLNGLMHKYGNPLDDRLYTSIQDFSMDSVEMSVEIDDGTCSTDDGTCPTIKNEELICLDQSNYRQEDWVGYAKEDWVGYAKIVVELIARYNGKFVSAFQLADKKYKDKFGYDPDPNWKKFIVSSFLGFKRGERDSLNVFKEFNQIEDVKWIIMNSGLVHNELGVINRWLQRYGI
ncbi:MAG: DEAD/DEAH box helicase [Myxococcales bacterium]|nr:DEAD/DEAH box helicase [Myxococcales bacterium]